MQTCFSKTQNQSRGKPWSQRIPHKRYWLKNKPLPALSTYKSMNWGSKEHSWILCQLCAAHSCKWCVNTKHPVSQNNPPAGQNIIGKSREWSECIVSSLGLTQQQILFSFWLSLFPPWLINFSSNLEEWHENKEEKTMGEKTCKWNSKGYRKE